MKYEAIDHQLFIDNRKRLAGHLLPSSIAIFNSNDVLPTNADGHMPFRQNNDLFYLTGVDQEETILLLFPEAANIKNREILFIRETNEFLAIWEGNKLTKDEAKNVSGISSVYWTHQFESILHNIIYEAENIYLNSNEHTRAEVQVKTRDDRFLQYSKDKYPLHQYRRVAPLMHSLRVIKSDIEIQLIRRACNITELGFRKILSVIKPGIKEYEIEAELTYEFQRNGSRGHAYNPIVASGSDSCILHYIKNNKVCKDGDIILLDVAAEYANYASDLTRVVPVNGKFTERQKEIYQAVYSILTNATKLLVPGNTYEKYTEEVGKLTEEALIKLKLLKPDDVRKQDPSNPLYKKYFMHGISHYLGLDVHDVGSRNIPFQEGMVLTCEPGIYVREEGIGIRLENDILISGHGPVNLMENIPIEIKDIEGLMRN